MLASESKTLTRTLPVTHTHTPLALTARSLLTPGARAVR